MKVVAFNGSPRRVGNTASAIRVVVEALEKQGIGVEIIHIGREGIRGCIACNWCVANDIDRCVFNRDPVNGWIEKMKEADGILLGSPVYFSGINGSMKSFLDRAGYVLSNHREVLRHKVGATVAAVRRTGGMDAFDQLNRYLQYFEMIQPASHYWNVIHGMRPGEVLRDEEGVQILRVLGRNMGWLTRVLREGKKRIPPPASEPKIVTNFIR